MSKLPSVSGQEVVDVLQRLGFRFVRQHGSHMILRRALIPNLGGRAK